MTKRIYDILLCLIIIFVLLIPCIFVWLAVKLTSSGPGIYWSKRVGRKGKVFNMPKFRTMKAGTPLIEKYKLLYPEKYITPIGWWLRRLSIDEIPQVFSVLVGDMSFVGPRPALTNQHRLNNKRKKLKIDELKPGITGLAQVNGRDEISLDQKISLDFHYLQNQSLIYDFKIILKTFLVILKSKNVSH